MSAPSSLGGFCAGILLNPHKFIPGLRLRFHQFALQLDHVFLRIGARLDKLVRSLGNLPILIGNSLVLPSLAVTGLLAKLDQTIV
jgi:hypothetical protein